MKRTVLLVILILCVSALIFAKPASGSFIPTVQATTGDINTLTAALATAAPAQQSMLVIQINNKLAVVNVALEEQEGVSTLGLTFEERALYAQTVTDLNLALRNCREVALAKGKTGLALGTRMNLNYLITIVMDQADEDTALYSELMGRAPAGGVTWGTVS